MSDKKNHQTNDTNTKFFYLWYIDDLKVFARKTEDLYKLLNCVEKFSNKIKVKFSLVKM